MKHTLYIMKHNKNARGDQKSYKNHILLEQIIHNRFSTLNVTLLTKFIYCQVRDNDLFFA